jgi:hypothetical protein
MTDTKFTPGPWTHDYVGDLRQKNGKMVTVWGLGVAHGSREEETEFNGILMSEASNLYSRLQDVIYDNQMYGHTTAHTLNEIENAMAKARGETQ